MNLFHFKKTSLPLTLAVMARLLIASHKQGLTEFAKTHELTLDHFLLHEEEGTTLLHRLAMTGALDEVTEILKDSRQKLTLEHFLIQNENGDTALHYATEGGHLDQVTEILKASGERLAPEHLLLKSMGETVIAIAARTNQLGQVFTPSLWVNHVGEMIEAWQKEVPEEHRAQINFEALRDEAISQSVRAAKLRAIDGAEMVRSGSGETPKEAAPLTPEKIHA